MPDTQPLSPADAAALLCGSAAAIAAEVRGLPEPLLRWHPADGEWCVKEVLGHLIEAERRGFAGRIRTILASERPAFQGWDPADVARSRKDCEAGTDALLTELLTMREDGAALVATLTPADLARGGVHPTVGALTVRDILQEWIHHDRNHLKQMLTNVQDYAWPHMGNAQKFSRP
jgi:hypothetical protein